MLKLALVVLCVVLLAYIAHTAVKPRPVQLLDYQRTTDDRSVAYVQFQASLKDANEPRADGILAYYDALEVMGLSITEARATAVVAAYLPDAPRAVLTAAFCALVRMNTHKTASECRGAIKKKVDTNFFFSETFFI